MRGIVLAGGTGSRLRPATSAACKQLLPVYDKPMVYYPISVLMLAGIREILLISTPEDLPSFRRLLGDGTHLGLRLEYAVQDAPRGLADAFRIGADFVADENVALVLGDNLFHGSGFSDVLARCVRDLDGAVLVGYEVDDPRGYGVAEIDDRGRLLSLEEKPQNPRSRLAVTGLYFYDPLVVEIARCLRPSARGELEITDVNRTYLEAGRASLVALGRGYAWLDTGTHESLLEASQFVQTLERRQGVRIACLEEIALRQGLIGAEECLELGLRLTGSEYGGYVVGVARSFLDEGPTVLEAV
ncbi:glucose-1-phosphate thymidylyltransferase RfbA [Pseudonocardia sp. ICBG162]|uniref:glucose-1-phosphate thymidylyltransferase RfbA n=1 Tax=Pseudonocardia sp. ICBG162 TaxID=2846761 RepID=UPI001CF6F4C9|nr:glucose-1-phosphate thymidylyltransferase RfbA [Pseudonocardia sp. ICBG162]